MTDLSSYLSEDQKREIAEEMFRDQLKEHLKDERQVSNHLHNISQHLVTKALEEHIGNEWQDLIVEKVKGDLRKGLQFYIFRESGRFQEEGPGNKHLRAAVDKHAERIEQRVLRHIEDLDDGDLGNLLRGALARRLGGTP